MRYSVCFGELSNYHALWGRVYLPCRMCAYCRIFGHGISYTNYTYSNLRLANTSMAAADDRHRNSSTVKHALGCLSWRQTGDCSPTGVRQPHDDKPCSSVIPVGYSGFCECAGNVTRGAVGCNAKKPFSCTGICANGGSSSGRGVTGTQNGSVYVSFSVQNVGKIHGTEVAQVYV